MRPPSPLFLLLAAASAVTGCSGSSPARTSRPAGTVTAQSVRCSQVIEQTGAPGTRIVFGAVAVPPVDLARAVATDSQQWPYFRKYGIVIRADSPALLVTVPKAWRRSMAISWGSNVGTVSSLRFLRCPQQAGLGPWNAYPGGFWLRSATGCVPLVFQEGRRKVTLRFAIGRRCSAVA